MWLKTLAYLIYKVKFQQVPIVLMEESVDRYDTIDFDKKSLHNFARNQIEDYSFKAKITCGFNSFSCFQSGISNNQQQYQYFQVRVYVLVGLVFCIREPVWVQGFCCWEVLIFVCWVYTFIANLVEVFIGVS